MAGVFCYFLVSAQSACTNPNPVPPGYAAPCPVFSISPAPVSQTGSLSLAASPQPGTDYIYTTAYYAKGSTWLATTLTGNNAAPSYSSGPATGSLPASILSALPLGTNYVVLWDWLWDATAGCYKGPGLNQCNTGTWRIQAFTLTSTATPTPTPSTSPISCTNCNQYYVSPTGSDSNPGTQSSPWATISHADSSFVLGINGTVIHLGPGTYNGDIITAHGGTADNRRVRWQSDTPYAAHIVGNGSNGRAWQVKGGYADFMNLDITGTASDYEGFSVWANHTRFIGNKIHDIANAGCPSNGEDGIGDASGTGTNYTDMQVIGNLIYNIGPNTSCYTTHGVYLSGIGHTVFNNIIGRVSGQCIASYHAATQAAISNNTVFNCIIGGILLSNSGTITPLPGGGNGGIGAFQNATVENNIEVNSPYGIYCDAVVSTNVRISNNLALDGFMNNHGQTCSFINNPPQNAPAFVNYLSSGLGDYHLTSGSAGINQGGASCASSPAITPCTPTTDFSGTTRPQGSAIDIGAYEQ